MATSAQVIGASMLFAVYAVFVLYAGVDNILDYIQDERHLDDAAYLYAPICGVVFYAGLSIDIRH